MINVNELRIGNRIEAVAQMGNYYMNMTEHNFTSLANDPNCANPIPLTPEILQKCGFEEKELPSNFANGQNGMKISIRDSAKRYLLLTPVGAHYLCAIYSSDNVFNLQSIGFVYNLHQLQNLYFAITKMELNTQSIIKS
jgi:hypothetical protein